MSIKKENKRNIQNDLKRTPRQDMAKLPKCRICLKPTNESVSLMEKSISELTNVDLIEKCTSIQINITNTSQRICSSCLNRLKIVHEFYTDCLACEETLNVKLEEFDEKIEETTVVFNEMKKKRKTVKAEEVAWDSVDNCLMQISTYSQATCPICCRKFTTKVTLLGHLHSVHKMPYKCRACDLFIPTWQEKIEHRLIHYKKKFQCSVCPKIYKSSYALQQHVEKIHSKGLTSTHDSVHSLRCERCKKTFKSKITLRVHMRKQHKIKMKCTSCEMTFNNSTERLAHIKTHWTKCIRCEHCGKLFGYKYRLIRHIETQHKNGVDFSGTETRKSPRFDASSNDDSDDENTKQKEDGAVDDDGEKKIVRVRNILKCLVCDATMPSTAMLKKHVQHEHTDKDGRIMCLKCTTTACNYKAYRMHLAELHGHRQYICVHCGMELKTSSSLRNHLKRHNKDYKYACDLCPKKFMFPYHLQSHKSVRHSDKRDIPCQTCGKRFAVRTQLIRHMSEVHTSGSHECDVCGKKFKNKSKFKIHHATHGPDTFSCDCCDKRFSLQKYLKKHMYTHTF